MQNNDAKQYLAFDALNGYYDLIKDAEKVNMEKRELTEDEEIELNENILKLKKKMMVSIIYYCNGEYVKKEGLVSSISYEYKIITVVKTKIPFLDILSIEII